MAELPSVFSSSMVKECLGILFLRKERESLSFLFILVTAFDDDMPNEQQERKGFPEGITLCIFQPVFFMHDLEGSLLEVNGQISFYSSFLP